MTITAVGELSVGATIPGPVALVAAAQVDLEAEIPAFAAAIALPTLTVATQITAVEQMLASLQLCLEIGIEPPSISVQIGLLAAKLLALKAELAVFVRLTQFFAAAGVFVYAFDGATNAAGGELTTQLSAGFPGHAPTAHANMLIMGTVDAATWTAMQAVFKTAP